MHQVAEIILAYLERSQSADWVYLPVFQQIALGALDAPAELAEAVRCARSDPDAVETLERFAAHLLRDRALRAWLAGQDLGGDRADFIDHFVLYASCVGPALGRALLHMTNPRHLVLIMLRIVTPGAFLSTGQWPDEPPHGECWDADQGWVPDHGRPWQPVATEIIRARIGADQAAHGVVFPEGFGKDAAQLNVSNALLDAAKSLRKELDKLAQGPLGPLLAVPASFADHTTALETAWSTVLPHALVRQYDYTASQRQWSCVLLYDPLITVDLIRQADERARTLSHSRDPKERALGQQVVGASIQNLVYAGALLTDTGIRERALQQWPFAFDGMLSKSPTPAELDGTLTRYLGGKPSLALWLNGTGRGQ